MKHEYRRRIQARRERVAEFNIHFPEEKEPEFRALLKQTFEKWSGSYHDRFLTLVAEVSYIAEASRWYYKEKQLRFEDIFAFLEPVALFLNSWKHE